MTGVRKAMLSLCAFALAALVAIPAAASGTASIPVEREIMVMVPHPPEHLRAGAAYAGSYGDELARSARQRLAERLARQYGLTLVDNYPMPMINIDCFIMAVPAGRSTDAAIAQVSRDRRVAWAQPVTIYQTQGAATHNDPLFAAQPAASLWQLAELHRVSTGRGVRVAVIDSAIDVHHPDLAGQVATSRNFVSGSSADAELHGTEVAGIIAARADNRLGVAGVAPGARLLGLRACWQKSAAVTVCDGFSLAKALYFAIEDKADVLNLSLGGPNDRLLRELLKAAMAHGAAVVAAYDRSRSDGGFPASMPGAIAVTDGSLARSPYSVYIAPGHDVPTTLPGGRWYLVNGSSFAAAHVSGLVALLRQKPGAGPTILVASNRAGGAINACATLERTFRDCDCSCSVAQTASARLQP